MLVSDVRKFVMLSISVLISGIACQATQDLAGEADRAASVPYDLAVLSVSLSPRVVPAGSLPVRITVKNTGSATWSPGAVRLVFTGDGPWRGADLALPMSTRPNRTVTFEGTLGASTQIGLYSMMWRAQRDGVVFGPVITARTEVTCSDGKFCNGDERYVKGKCVDGPRPCDFGTSCTVYECDEGSGSCVPRERCQMCAAKRCNPNCKDRQCGDDGCGGGCPVNTDGTCPSGQVCSGGACVVANVPGTCSAPLPLMPGANPDVALPAGVYTRSGDTTNGFNEVQPACNPTAAREQVFKLVVNQTMGIDAQSFGFDTVLHIHAGSCFGPLVACSDDAAPPGNYGSHVFAMLQPGTYFIVVDGFDDRAFGSFTLAVRLVPGCVPQCDGKFCGDDGCGNPNGCGGCGAGQVCSPSGRCVADPCTPGSGCGGRQCGADLCGNPDACGTCQTGKACDEVTGACKNVSECNHDRPVCKPQCASTEYCGTDCRCHRARDARPDLIVNRARLMDEILFDTLNVSPTSCTVVEQCVEGTGLRRLLRFSVEAINQGSATLSVPPPKNRPDLFQFSPCHGHYHFSGFATYALLDLAGNPVRTGRKQAYCMEDTYQVIQGPNIGCHKVYDCEKQSIQAGWSDLYGNSLDCQWLDITGLPRGNYQLQVSLNPNRAFEEASFDNNTATVPVFVP